MRRLVSAMPGLVSAMPGLVSVWWGRPGAAPIFAVNADETHYAASLMKLAVFEAARSLPRDRPVLVHDTFASVAAGRFTLLRNDDNDDEVWAVLGTEVPLGWLAERMLTHSSNLATDLVLEALGRAIAGLADTWPDGKGPATAELATAGLAAAGLAAADAVWRRVGAAHSTVQLGIGDAAAPPTGRSNKVTCADLALLLATLDPATTPTQVIGPEIISALPPGTRVLRKGGWVDGVRHAAGLIMPDDAPPFILAVCTTTPAPDDQALALIHDLTAHAWAHRMNDPPSRP